LKQYIAVITLIIDAENEIEALEDVNNYLALGVIPEGVSIQEVRQ